MPKDHGISQGQEYFCRMKIGEMIAKQVSVTNRGPAWIVGYKASRSDLNSGRNGPCSGKTGTSCTSITVLRYDNRSSWGWEGFELGNVCLFLPHEEPGCLIKVAIVEIAVPRN